MYLPSLRRLVAYDVAIICDDSGSMNLPADSDNPNLSRWAELKQSVQILLRITEAMGKTVDVYFLNRGCFYGIVSWSQIAGQFDPRPGGYTNTVAILQLVWMHRQQNQVAERPFVLHLFTDGHPTDENGNENMQTFARWMSTRQFMQNTFIAILLCTDDEEVDAAYRPLEYRVRGQYGWIGATCGVPGVDVTEDYRGEKRDVLALRGQNYSFTFGDFIAKALVGVIDPMVHIIDMPTGTSIYGSRSLGGGGGGCATQ